MAQNLGLHRNCDTWNLSEEEKQERKRTFFCWQVENEYYMSNSLLTLLIASLLIDLLVQCMVDHP